MKKAFQVNGVSVYGASLEEAILVHNSFDLVISLEKRDLSLYQKARNILGLTKWIKIEWPDFSVPLMNREDWNGIAKVIFSGRYKNVLVHCMGGIGRTGTALAILSRLGGIEENILEDIEVEGGYKEIEKKLTPIEFIRSNYLSYAVETIEQERYVMDIVGDVK